MRHVRLALPLLAVLAVPAAFAGSFDRYHPDQYFANLAVEQADEGNLDAAVLSFQRAARYAYKPAQMAVALAYWNGEGVSVDRPRAYAWADLAAERGYPAFLAARERMWGELSADEQAQAKAIGQELAKEYADAHAKKRLEGLLRQGGRQKTGTRTGSGTAAMSTSRIDPSARAAMISTMSTAMANNIVPGQAEAFPGAKMVVFSVAMRAAQNWSAPGYYDDSNWKPAVYWKTLDKLWSELPAGTVEVAPPRKAD